MVFLTLRSASVKIALTWLLRASTVNKVALLAAK